MFKITKPKGYNACAIVEDVSTSSTYMLGQITQDMIDILAEIGFSVNRYEEINIEITKETANALVKSTSKAKKPIRNQSKNNQDNAKEELVDLYDLIFHRK